MELLQVKLLFLLVQTTGFFSDMQSSINFSDKLICKLIYESKVEYNGILIQTKMFQQQALSDFLPILKTDRLATCKR